MYKVTKNNYRPWINKLRHKLKKWTILDPEYQHYISDPKGEKGYRHLSPTSQPQAQVPNVPDDSRFFDDFEDRDHLLKKKDFYVVYRKDLVKNPVRLLPGEVCGPFHSPLIKDTVTHFETTEGTKRAYVAKKEAKRQEVIDHQEQQKVIQRLRHEIYQELHDEAVARRQKDQI